MSAIDKQSIRDQLTRVTGIDIGEIHPEAFITHDQGGIGVEVKAIEKLMVMKFHAIAPGALFPLWQTSYN